MRRTFSLPCLLLLAVPAQVAGQGVSDMMGGVRSGGGWVNIPIVAGSGRFETPMLPSMTMSLRGCLNVWPGHTGEWTIEAHETVMDETVRLEAEPGVGVPFEHTFGLRAQIDFDFTWSESRDTTLYLWVGVDLKNEGAQSVCEPPEEGEALGAN